MELLSKIPIARNTDPRSSHGAASEVTRSGARATQQHIALMVVQEFPGSTTRELSRECQLGIHALGRRLPELCKAGLITKGDLRKCKVGNRIATPWFPMVVNS